MKTKSIPSAWLTRDGCRLDCNPYMSGALEARVLLESLKAKKERLASLTAGHKGGIYNGPQFKRNYVDSSEHGVQFLTGGDVLSADTSRLPLLSRRDATSPKLSYLRLEPGMTLISCSGAIGRMSYVRSDMKGIWSSQDVMKVVPDPEKIPPGYLYAYLSSKFGVPLVVGGTYGAIIQHIEPEHIADLPVPRFDEDFEKNVHKQIDRAAQLRAQAAQLLVDATAELEKISGLYPLEAPPSPTPFDTCAVSSGSLQSRLDGFFHSRFHNEALTALSRATTKQLTELASDIVEPIRFKRVSVDDAAFGVPFFGTSPLFWADPTPNYFVSKKMRNIGHYLVDKKCLLIPRSGQLSGIIGSVVLPYGDVVGGAVSEDAIRVYFESEQDAGFGLIALTSEYGRRQLKARAFGSSIPHLDVRHIGLVRVPDPGPDARADLGARGARVAELRDEACRVERNARALLEARIEKGTV